MIIPLPVRVCLIIIVLVAAVALPRGAKAQPCGPAASGVLAESTVCSAFVRISWTNPPGVVFPKVWRSADQNFASAALIYNPGLGGAPLYYDTPPTANTNYYYWVGGDVVGCEGDLNPRAVPLTGPLPAGRFTVNSYPTPKSELTCSGPRISWQPAWDVTQWMLIRVFSRSTSEQEVLGNFERGVTSFTDTTALPGSKALYAVSIGSDCGSTTSTHHTGYLRVGPWNGAAAQGASVNVGGTVSLVIYNPAEAQEAFSSPEPISYAWVRDGVPLVDGAKYAGTQTFSLSIRDVRLEDAGKYRMTAQTGCASFTVEAFLAVTQPCRADFNQSGAVSVQDVFDYLTAFFSGCP